MSEEKLYQIKELPDLKVNWTESCKCLNEPLLEYVWEVANQFLPDYEETDTGMIPVESFAHAIFANRYAYKLDVSKFWYLLLFVYDFIEDIGTNAPIMGKSVLEDFATFLTNLCDASSITLKQGNRKSYYTEREDLINIIQIAVHHFSETYGKIVNGEQDRETKIKQLKELGLKGFIDNSLLSQMNFKDKFSLDISYKKWKFTDMFLFFIEKRKAATIPNKKVKVSKDKMMLVSRLIYTVGYDGKRYNEEYDSEGNKNRMLSNLLRRYKNEKFPSVIANNYNVVS